MATRRNQLYVPPHPEAVEALRRQAAISGWSMAQLIEALGLRGGARRGGRPLRAAVFAV